MRYNTFSSSAGIRTMPSTITLHRFHFRAAFALPKSYCGIKTTQLFPCQLVILQAQQKSVQRKETCCPLGQVSDTKNPSSLKRIRVPKLLMRQHAKTINTTLSGIKTHAASHCSPSSSRTDTIEVSIHNEGSNITTPNINSHLHGRYFSSSIRILPCGTVKTVPCRHSIIHRGACRKNS